MKKFIFLFSLVALLSIANSTAVYAAETATVTVNGEGVVTIEPDVAQVFLGVETQSEDAVAAQNQNSLIITEVMDALQALGISEDDIQTAHFNMFPMQDWRDGWGQHIGYQVSHGLQITVRDIDMVGYVLSTATGAGANMSSHVSFGLLDDTAAYSQALTLAIANAQTKAQTIAGALNISLGNVVHVVETSSPFFMPATRFASDMAMPMAEAAGAGIPVQTGELTVVAMVSVTFNLVP